MSQKYRSISDTDFDIESVSKTIDQKDVIPEGYEESMTEAERNIPRVKVVAQRRATIKSLGSLARDLHYERN